MKILHKIIIVTLLFMILSCKRDKKNEPIIIDNGANTEVNYNKTESKSSVEFSDKKTQEIYNLYLEIKGALVNSDDTKVKLMSKELVSALEKSEYSKQLKATSKLLSLTKELKKQRDFFVALTSEIEKVVHNANISSGKVFKQYCPMALGGEGGYWLSDSKEIRNPYFGSKMLTCGSVNEVME